MPKQRHTPQQIESIREYRRKLRSNVLGVSEAVVNGIETLAQLALPNVVDTGLSDQPDTHTHPTLGAKESQITHCILMTSNAGQEGDDNNGANSGLKQEDFVAALCQEMKAMRTESLQLLDQLITERKKDDPAARFQANRLRDAQKLLIKPPEPFSRPTALRSTDKFLDEYHAYAQAITEDQATIFKGLQSFLKEEALATYKTFVTTYPEKTSFYSVAQELRKEYDTLSPEERLRTYAHRKQKEGESVIEYGREITLLMAPSTLNETVKIEFFINNLLPKFKQLVISRQPINLKQAITYAQEGEATLAAQQAGLDELKNTFFKHSEPKENAVQMIKSVSWQDRKYARGRRYSRDRQYNRPYSRESSPSSGSRPSSPGSPFESRNNSSDGYSSREGSRERPHRYDRERYSRRRNHHSDKDQFRSSNSDYHYRKTDKYKGKPHPRHEQRSRDERRHGSGKRTATPGPSTPPTSDQELN